MTDAERLREIAGEAMDKDVFDCTWIEDLRSIASRLEKREAATNELLAMVAQNQLRSPPRWTWLPCYLKPLAEKVENLRHAMKEAER